MNRRLPAENLPADLVIAPHAVKYILPECLVVDFQRSPSRGELDLPCQLAVAYPADAVMPAAFYFQNFSCIGIFPGKILVALVMNRAILVKAIHARRVQPSAF